MTRLLLAPAALALGLLLTACGAGPANSTGGTAAATPERPSATTTSASSSASRAVTASQLTTELKGVAGIPISRPIVYTAETDPNHKLGRPGGYTSKSAWIDSRVKASDAHDTSRGSVDLGGGVEVFSTAAGAQARGAFIQAAYQRMQMGGEYDYVAGAVLLRLSTVLTPAQAKGYADALTKVVGTPAVAVDA